MQDSSIERSPVVLDRFFNGEFDDDHRSVAIFTGMLSSLVVLESTYGMGTDHQTSFSDDDFTGWLQRHKEAQERPEYETYRGVTEVAIIMGLDGPHQIGLEVAGQDVLEVGPGAGLFARFVARHAANLTLLDSSLDLYGAPALPPSAQVIIDRIQGAEIDEASFDKVFDIFAALMWGADMRSTAIALYKELHVTKNGGSLFAIPLFTKLIQRAEGYLGQGVSGEDIDPNDAFRDFRDYTLGRSIIRLMAQGQVGATFGIDIWDRAEDSGFYYGPGRYFDSIWAILDKTDDIPALPPDDLLRLGYELQDGTKLSSTLSEELDCTIDDLDLHAALDIEALHTSTTSNNFLL